MGLVGVASALSRLFFGWLSDHIRDAKYPFARGFLFMTAGMFLLLKATSATILFIYPVLFGFGY